MIKESIHNFVDLFKEICSSYGDSPVINYKAGNTYEHITGSKLKELTFLLAKALRQFNLFGGDKVAIISETRFEWVVTDFACIVNNFVTVPIYTNMTTEQIKYILEHSEAKLCFVSTKLLAEKVNSIFDEMPSLIKIINFNKLNDMNENAISFEELVSDNLFDNESADKYFEEASLKIHEHSLLTIIYTSGTTGEPKGVCLTHKNILSNVRACSKAIPVNSDDTFLSFLPLAHTYERTAGYYLPLAIGAKLFYAQSIDTLQLQMTEVKPTILVSVPILFTKIHTRILKNIETQPGVKKYIGKKSLSIGLKYIDNQNHFLWKLADKKVFSTIRERTGGRIRYFISGGSALNKESALFFKSIGINILEGYGMTEASPVISVNRDVASMIGTVGIPLDEVEVRIADDGEILVRGNNVMLGYYKDEKETSETIIDGWLHTGDIGEFAEGKFLKITDRKKALIKTSGGKYISLTHIEETISSSKYVEQIIAIASDDTQFVSALIVPNFEELSLFAQKNYLMDKTNNELIKEEIILKEVERDINSAQKNLAKYERVRKFALLEQPFTIETGELTPTLKPKRKIIENKYQYIIYAFYKNKSEP